jgi:hypothetical protein
MLRAMSPWFQHVFDVAQLFVNVGALVGGAIIWKLYVAKLKATLAVKDAEISSVEKNRDMWRDQAEELQKRSPEFMERVLSERIDTRETEISRLQEDKDRNLEALEVLEREKSKIALDLSRTRGFQLMLALDEGVDDEDGNSVEGALSSPVQPDEISVVLLGEVAVDSGQLMVADPCYIDDEWQHEAAMVDRYRENSSEQGAPRVDEASGGIRLAANKASFSYSGAVEKTLSSGFGELAFKMGHTGAGVVFSTAWGDGMYSIYGEMHAGRIVRAYINLG